MPAVPHRQRRQEAFFPGAEEIAKLLGEVVHGSSQACHPLHVAGREHTPLDQRRILVPTAANGRWPIQFVR
jgi:hypothetical protein